MNVYRNFDEIERDDRSAITLGTFDGVHLGHKKVISRLLEIARESGLRPVAATLYPHPRIALNKEGAERLELITTLEERFGLFEKLGLENLLVIPFTLELAKVSPKDFVIEYLMGKVGFSKILVGYDHSFGRNREGDENLLKELGSKYNFEIERVEPFALDGTTISSTKIRRAIKAGELEKANKFLGYEFFIVGEVEKGEGRGKEIGFPTANIGGLHPRKILPKKGVYLVSVEIRGKKFFGMANVGSRPTFYDEKAPIAIEAHIFDFDENIYGERAKLSFLKKLRDERKFGSQKELAAQLKKDEEKAKETLKKFYN